MSAARGTAPAFQVYAHDLLSRRDFRLMSFDERGLLLTIWCECWANVTVPSSPKELATWLGKSEVSLALTDRVKRFLDESDGNFTSPDIEEYRKKVLEGRKNMSEGGRKGGKRSAEKRREASMN